MNTSLQTRQQLITDFEQAQTGFIKSVSQSMDHAFTMGEILTRLKEVVPHGEFETVLKNEARFAFGTRYAQTLMKIARHKEYLLEHNNGEILSVREMERIVSKRPSNQPEPVDATPAGDEAIAKEQPSFPGKEGQEDAIEGEYTEVTTELEPAPPALPTPEPESADEDEVLYSDEDRTTDLVDDLIKENTRLEADNARMRAIFEDDNHTMAAIKANERLVSVNAGLQARIDGLLNENAAMQQQLNRLDRRCKLLDKKLKEAGSHE